MKIRADLLWNLHAEFIDGDVVDEVLEHRCKTVHLVLILSSVEKYGSLDSFIF